MTERPAARAGARVSGLDLVPRLLDEGRAEAEAAGLTIDWSKETPSNFRSTTGASTASSRRSVTCSRHATSSPRTRWHASFDFERHVNWAEAESLDRFADYFMDNFPTMVAGRPMLG
jgi:hypothetical protein